jgi:hypothetical protein
LDHVNEVGIGGPENLVDHARSKDRLLRRAERNTGANKQADWDEEIPERRSGTDPCRIHEVLFIISAERRKVDVMG